jgi:thymidylate synthase
MNKLDKTYTDLLQDILDNGVNKQTRNGGTLSIFGRQIRHSMKDGFPLLTTKKMAWKTMVVELLWFLRGDTNIKYLVDNGCHIWDGDAYKNFVNIVERSRPKDYSRPILSQEEFIDRIKTDDEFAKRWGSLGKIYGHQWRSWTNYTGDEINEGSYEMTNEPIDQISELIKQLKDNPDSRRMVVSAWAVHDLPNMVLPPCHYGFQVYTRELSFEERLKIANIENPSTDNKMIFLDYISVLDKRNVPTRAISLMWNQRSVDTFLGLPFNIASYGLLLEIIAKAVNMVPDELIGNLGDVHLYSNHVEQAKEQIGRELVIEERVKWAYDRKLIDYVTMVETEELDKLSVPTRTREPYPLPTLNINTEFWPTEGGECGVGPLDAVAVFNSFRNDDFCRCLLEEDIQLSNYQSHPSIKAPLSN